MGKTTKRRREDISAIEAIEAIEVNRSDNGDIHDYDAISLLMAESMNREAKKKTRKVERKFALSILEEAKNSDWEDHELAKLIFLISGKMGLSNKKLLKFLRKSSVCTTDLLACLGDGGVVFPAKTALSLLKAKAKDSRHMSSLITQGIDHGIFNPCNSDLIEALRDMTISEGYGSSDVKSLMSALCSHADSMRECGRVLAAFCADFSAEVAAAYIRDVMSLQFVNELDGKLGDMLDELPDIRSAVEEALEGVLQVDKHGRVLPADSDADSDGNLRDFIDDDDVIRYATDSSDADCKGRSSRTSGYVVDVYESVSSSSYETDDDDNDDEESEDEVFEEGGEVVRISSRMSYGRVVEEGSSSEEDAMPVSSGIAAGRVSEASTQSSEDEAQWSEDEEPLMQPRRGGSRRLSSTLEDSD
mmetsp:Transcript_3853/g.5998  ORF Transcript_3853/g.5998 Transcript_3853/m.5998 type:complete len:417 (+) Transcript_3853:52-1302(+)